MRVLMYTTMPIFPIDYGGVVRIYNISKKIVETGINVTLFSPKPMQNYQIVNQNFDCLFFNSTSDTFANRFKPIKKFKHFLSIFLFFNEYKVLDKKISESSSKDNLILQAEYMYSIALLYIFKKKYSLPLIVTQHNVEADVFLEINGNRFYYHILKNIEHILLKFCDHIICVSENDKLIMMEKYKIASEKISIGPNATSIQNNDQEMNLKSLDIKKSLKIKDDEYVVVFMGTLQYLPNKRAIEVIKNDIYPLVRLKIPNVKFLIVGKGVNPSILDGIIFTGSVDDVTPYINISDVAIAPLIQGGGTRLKIIEYMALSKPVVSTSKGAEGLEFINSKDLIIADDWIEFANKIVELLRDENKRKEIGKNARKLVENNYTWDSTCNVYIDVYTKLSTI